MLTCLRSKRFRDRISDRKLRLFGVACCRRVWTLLTEECCRHAVEVAERLAEGGVPHEERATACGTVAGVLLSLPAGVPASLRAAYDAAWNVAGAPERHSPLMAAAKALAAEAGGTEAAEYQAELLRCIFGDPFRPAAIEAAWRSDTAQALARQMYESRDFSAMPILADALQDAECEDAELLGHCRGPGTHARGCWVVDLVLGKE
jgi:hypothetical protein